MRVWSVEGNRQRLDGGAMFGNAPRAMWAQWIAPDERNRVELACRAMLVDDLDGKRVLFEAGIGAFFEPKLKTRYGVMESRHVLLDSLEKCGMPHDRIDVVVLSHLHFDHAGGLLTAYEEGPPTELLFPNARYVVSRRAWERALNPHPRDRASFVPELNRLLAGSGRLELVDGEPCAGPRGCRAPELHGRPHSRARARRGRRGWRCRVLLRPDPRPPVGASARDHGLRPGIRSSSSTRNAGSSRTRPRAASACSLRTISNVLSQHPCATRATASASRTNCAAWRRLSSEAARRALLTGTAAPYTWRPERDGHDAPVAQLDRVPGFEPGGREFESLRARQPTKGVNRSHGLHLVPETWLTLSPVRTSRWKSRCPSSGFR